MQPSFFPASVKSQSIPPNRIRPPENFLEDIISYMWFSAEAEPEMTPELRIVSLFANEFLVKSTIIIYSDPLCHHISSYFSAIPEQQQIMP